MSLIPALVIVTLLSTNEARNNIEFTKDSLEVVRQNVLKKKAILVDVRSEKEWQQGHIEDSIFLPVTSLRKGGDAKMLAKKLPKKKVLYTFCVVGMRARTAAYALEKHGYTVRALKPGYEELIEAGFKKGKNKKEAARSAGEDENTRQRNGDEPLSQVIDLPPWHYGIRLALRPDVSPLTCITRGS